MTTLTLGYSQHDLDHSPYAEFYNPEIDPVQLQVAEALTVGGQAHVLFRPVSATGTLLTPGYWPVETKYARAPDSAIRAFCFTEMPRVEPKIWDWWFGWHSCGAERSKL